MKTLTSIAAAALIVIAAPLAATAQTKAATGVGVAGIKVDASATPMAEGEVRKIDKPRPVRSRTLSG